MKSDRFYSFFIFSALALFYLFSFVAGARPGQTAKNNLKFSEPLSDDNYLQFLDQAEPTLNLRTLDERKLTQGQASFEPWSGSYWPVHRGVLGARFADPNFPNSKNFTTNYEFITAQPPDVLVQAGQIEMLSPAEKYDLLVGDTSWTLSKFMWGKGLQDIAESGDVESWTGICHGLAGATHMQTPLPKSSVEVMDVTGTHLIRFFATDIKGLISWIWADSAPSAVRAGNRCRSDEVLKDPYFRPTELACLDSNPMTWHLAIVNRVGQKGLSLVMDSSNGPEVWNYAVTAYDYNYFDPKTFEMTHSLSQALRAIETIPNDRFSGYRSPRTRYLVGVSMDVFHPALTDAIPQDNDTVVTEKETFNYDLELDENYEIVGGEWYSPKNPDFLWMFHDGSRAISREDLILETSGVGWSSDRPMTESIAEKARAGSIRGKILTTIGNALVQTSSR